MRDAAKTAAKAETVTTVEAVIHRANGRVEDLGVIARSHSTLLQRVRDQLRGIGHVHHGERS